MFHFFIAAEFPPSCAQPFTIISRHQQTQLAIDTRVIKTMRGKCVRSNLIRRQWWKERE